MGLARLTIQNIVLIDHLVIDFQGGLCALTGETGAGKSILLDSLGLALGERSDSGLVRHGQEKASVTAEFDLTPSHLVFKILQEHDIAVEQGESVILRRTLTHDGRSRAYINDQSVSVKMLRDAGEMLIEIHGQFEVRGLLDVSTHRAMLDDYVGVKYALKSLWENYHHQQTILQKLKDDLEQSRTEEEFLRCSIEDLDALAPKAGEESQLSSLRERLIHRERVFEALNTAYESLSGDDDPVRIAWGALDRVADKMPESANGILEALSRASAEAEEARSAIQSLSSDMEHEEHNLETIDERLYALKNQARKHGCEVDDLSAKRDDMAERLNRLEHAEDTVSDQIKATEAAYQGYVQEARAVSQKRKDVAAQLDQKIMKELEPLKLGKAKFLTQIEELPADQWGESGIDQVRFLVATNPGSAPGPLNKIASGGEMSRFMLALKVVMSEVGAAETLIFDEVDAGIGGSTADAVGERLASLAQDYQVLVVTHAPQVAARARHHYIVSKGGEDAITSTVYRLDLENERQEEIARMLAGASVTEEARAAAQRLMENAA